jgi:hypothetical protein
VCELLAIAVSVCCATLAVLAGGAVLPQPHTRVVHVFVALADNQHQGIVTVSSRLGNGQDAARNLYWGAAFGVKTFFKASSEWRVLKCTTSQQPPLLERCVFRHQSPEVILVADVYDGARIRDAVSDFVSSAAGLREETLSLALDHENCSLPLAGAANPLAYVGHDAFMDFQIPRVVGMTGGHKREFVILDCARKPYFDPYMRDTQSQPLLWTTGLMAPEAYTLEAVLQGWMLSESTESIRQRAASAYDKYQKCGSRAAQRLFAGGW